MPLTNYAKDKFVAPELSKLTECNAIDMSGYNPNHQHWVGNFILNTMLRVNMDDRSRAFRIMLLRRVEMSFYEHENGRLALQAYINNPDEIHLYLRAIFHFENFLGQSWQAYAILRKMANQDVFSKGDGSVIQRINELWGRSKHPDTAINSGQLTKHATMPVWISNYGLCAEGTQLSYEEMAEILKRLSKIADVLSNPTNP